MKGSLLGNVAAGRVFGTTKLLFLSLRQHSGPARTEQEPARAALFLLCRPRRLPPRSSTGLPSRRSPHPPRRKGPMTDVVASVRQRLFTRARRLEKLTRESEEDEERLTEAAAQGAGPQAGELAGTLGCLCVDQLRPALRDLRQAAL